MVIHRSSAGPAAPHPELRGNHGPVDDELRVLPCGDRALLVEVADLGGVAAVRTALEQSPLPGQRELVPAARTVLVLLDRAPAEADLAALRRLRPSRTEAAPPADVVELTAAELTVAFGGFAPGFGYLAGLPPHLHVPRRSTPRTRVPAGALGLAGAFAGVYPTSSPGGWQLVGRTDAVLFDVDREPPALLRPGVRVRLRSLS
jgi:allophanate hydrolase subunit 1